MKNIVDKMNTRSLTFGSIFLCGFFLMYLWYSSTKQLSNMRFQSDQYQFKINSLKSKLNEQETKIKFLKEKFDAKEKDHKIKKNEYLKLTEENQNLVQEKVILQNEYDKIKKEYVKIKEANLQSSMKRNETNQSILDNYNKDIKKLKLERDSLLLKLQRLTLKNLNDDEKIKSAENENEDGKTKSVTYENVSGTLNSDKSKNDEYKKLNNDVKKEVHPDNAITKKLLENETEAHKIQISHDKIHGELNPNDIKQRIEKIRGLQPPVVQKKLPNPKLGLDPNNGDIKKFNKADMIDNDKIGKVEQENPKNPKILRQFNPNQEDKDMR